MAIPGFPMIGRSDRRERLGRCPICHDEVVAGDELGGLRGLVVHRSSATYRGSVSARAGAGEATRAA